MLNEVESTSKRLWNVQDLLKYNTNPKPSHPQVLKNIEKAKQVDITKNPSVELSNDEERVSRISLRSKHELESIKTDISKPLFKKELQPLTHKPRNSEQFAATGQRLAKLEMLCNNQREEIKAKSQLIEKLYKEASVSKKNYQDEIVELKDENKMLKEEIEKLLKFLDKHCLKLEEEEGEEEEKRIASPVKKQESVYVELPSPEKLAEMNSPITPVRNRLPKEIDFKLIKKRIDDLNDLIDGEQDIVKDKYGAYKFQRRDPIGFTIFKDGIQIEGFPFYKYSHKESQDILEDILDCYFPAILKDKYPEGIPFELINKIEMTNQEVESASPIKKSGLRVIKEIARSNHFITNQSGPKENSRSVSKRDFSLDKKPEDYIEISTANYEKEIVNNKTEALQEITATLKIRTETGKKTLILKALTSDTITMVYNKIKGHSETQNYEIWGGYPPRVYPNNEEQTLLDLDITGESVFNLRSVSSFKLK